jgi:hypothetical protein
MDNEEYENDVKEEQQPFINNLTDPHWHKKILKTKKSLNCQLAIKTLQATKEWPALMGRLRRIKYSGMQLETNTMRCTTPISG